MELLSVASRLALEALESKKPPTRGRFWRGKTRQKKSPAQSIASSGFLCYTMRVAG